MAVTKKAIRRLEEKTLNRRLKRQKRNAEMVTKRIKRIEKQLWKLELDDLNEKGLLQQLTWEFEPNVELFNCHATGIRSKETNSNSEVVKEIQKWFWEYHNERFACVEFSRKVIDGYNIFLGLQMEYVGDDEMDGGDSGEDMAIVIYAIDVDDREGTGKESEKSVIKSFVKKWDIKVDIK